MTYTVVYHPAVVREDIPALGAMTKKQIRLAIEKTHNVSRCVRKAASPIPKGVSQTPRWRLACYFRIENKIVKFSLLAIALWCTKRTIDDGKIITLMQTLLLVFSRLV